MGILGVINLIIIGYVLPAMVSYMSTRWMYTYHYTHIKPGMGDMFFVLCPFFNIIAAFATTAIVIQQKLEGRGKATKKGPSIGEIFFRVKKRGD